MIKKQVLARTITLWAILWSILFYTHLNVGTNQVPIFNSATQFVHNPMNYVWGIVTFIVLYVLTYVVKQHGKEIGNFIYRYRYVIALSILVIGVCLELNGSSIGMWANFIGGYENDTILLGTSRGLRSDEWAASTSLGLSQAFQNPAFPYFSEAVRGSTTDMFIVYGQPVWDIAMIFRPSYWGYLFLGSTKGLSFFWLFRQLLLLLTMFELGMILTKKNRTLSLLMTILITFSPVVQWWFAVNGIVEIFAMGSIAVIIVHYYLNEKSYLKKIAYALGLSWCGVVYILTFYPAWQVPMGYVFLCLIIYVVIDNWKHKQWQWQKDSLIIALFLIILSASLGYVILKSQDTLKAVLNTVYPGNRVDTGGSWGHILTDYPFSIFYTITGLSWERGMDVFYDFFPLSTLFAAFVWWKTKDKLLTVLLILNLFFFIYITVGIPVILAKFTLMSYTMGVRTVVPFGVVNVLLLIRSLSLYKIKVTKPMAVSGVVTLILMTLSTILHYDYIKEIQQFLLVNQASTIVIYIVTILVIVIASLCIYRSIYLITTHQYKSLAIYLTLVSVFFGMLVNPVRKGTDVIYKNELIQTIQKINTQHPGKWIVEGMNYPYINLPLLVGAATINSTNVYPDLQKWHEIDATKQYEAVYNRYAHIRVDIENNNNAQFILTHPDTFTLKATINDLKKLQVTYILSQNNLDEQYSDSVEKIATVGNFKLFKLLP